MSEASTASTSPSTTDHQRATRAWQRLGGVVAAPVNGFRALIDDPRAHPLEPFIVYAVVAFALAGADVYRLVSLLGDAPLVIAKRLLDVVLRIGRTDFAVVIGAALVVGGVAHARAARAPEAERGRFIGAAIATSYLLVVLALLKSVGGLLAVLALDLWWLPHHAVDSFAVVVASADSAGGRQVSWLRFVVKCVVAYGPGLAVLIVWLREPSGRVRADADARARVGLAILVAVVGAFVVASAVDVGRRSDVLRPSQRGDLFPSLALRPLSSSEGKARRVDVQRAARTAPTRVTIVDFWASWCGPCRRSMPALSKLNEGWQSAHPGEVLVVGVNREPSDAAAARQAWTELAPSFSSLIDDKGLGEKLGLNSLPSSYVLDGEGIIRHIHLGTVDADVIAGEVAALLEESNKAAPP